MVLFWGCIEREAESNASKHAEWTWSLGEPRRFPNSWTGIGQQGLVCLFVELFSLVCLLWICPCYFFFLILPSGSLIKLTHEIYGNIINDKEAWEDFIPFKEHRVLYIDCRPADTEVQSVAQHWLLWYLHYPWEEAPVNRSGVILIAMIDSIHF